MTISNFLQIVNVCIKLHASDIVKTWLGSILHKLKIDKINDPFSLQIHMISQALLILNYNYMYMYRVAVCLPGCNAVVKLCCALMV